MGYDAFISYSHAADGALAPAIQDGLQRLAKPWNRRRALHVFRDETGLSVNPHLWESIVGALDSSRWFIVLASPEAAASPWVNREIEHFLASGERARERLLPVVTDGVWEWDEDAGAFASTTDCVPPALANAFSDEPRHLDLSWARTEVQLDLRRADFRAAIADIAAPIHGIAKDDLESEDIRIHRRNRRARRAAFGALGTLTVGLTIAVIAAIGFADSARDAQRDAEVEAERAREAEADALEAQAFAESETERAESETARAVSAEELAEANAEEASANALTARSSELAARSSTALDTEPELAALLAVQANYPGGEPTDDPPDEALDAVGVATRRLTESNARRLPGELTGYTEILPAVEARMLAIVHDGRVELASADDERLFDDVTRDDAIVAAIDVSGLDDLFVSADASLLVGSTGRPDEAESSVDEATFAIDSENGERFLVGPGRPIAVSSSGSYVAVRQAGSADGPSHDDPDAVIVVYDVADRSDDPSAAPVPAVRIPLRPPGTRSTTAITSAGFSPDETSFAWIQAVPAVFDFVINTFGGDVVRVTSLIDRTDGAGEVTIPIDDTYEALRWIDDDQLALVSALGNLEVWDRSFGSLVPAPELDIFVPRLGDDDPVTYWIDADTTTTIDDDGRLRTEAGDSFFSARLPSPFSDLVWVDPALIVVAGEDGRARRYARQANGTVDSALADPTGRLAFVDGAAVERSTGETVWATDGRFADIDLTGRRVVEIVDDRIVVRDTAKGAVVAEWSVPAEVLGLGGPFDAPSMPVGAVFVGDGSELIVDRGRFDTIEGTVLEITPDPLSLTGGVLATSPDGTMTIERTVDGETGASELSVHDLVTGAHRALDVTVDVGAATWQSDDTVLLGASNGEILQVELSTLDHRILFQPTRQPIVALEWAPTRERLFIVGGGGELVRGVGLIATLDGEIIDSIPSAGSAVEGVRVDDGSGYWVGGPGFFNWIPDGDLRLTCRLALPVAAAAFESLVGEPSVCLTRPELEG